MNSIIKLILKNNYTVYSSILILLVLLYGKNLFFGFSPMDEQWLIVKNAPFLTGPKPIIEAFTKPTLGIYYRPFFLLSFVLDYRIGQLSPFYFHLSNLIYHFIFCCLFFRFLTLFSVPKQTALIFVSIFIFHPLLLHAVALIPGRNDLIFGIFALSSIICLIQYLKSFSLYSLVLHFLFFICALLTKENAITLPLIYIFLYYITIKPSKKQLLVFILFWITISISWFILRKNIVSVIPLFSSNWWLLFKNFTLANFVFLGKVLFPFNLSVFPTLQNSTPFYGIVSLLLLVFSWFYIGVKSKSVAVFGLFIYFILLAIPTWFGSVNSAGEHLESRMYTSLIGIILFVSQLKIDWQSKKVIYILGLIVLVFGIKTFVRMDIYKSEISFTEAGLKDAPEYYLFQVQKADYEYANKNFNAAITFYSKAIELRPDRAEIFNSRANSYVALNNNAEAIKDFNKSLELEGFHEVIVINRCLSYFALGDLDNAMADLITIKKCCPNVIPPNLEKELTEKWITKELSKLNALIASDPNNDLNYFNRAKRFLNVNLFNEAKKDMETACMLNPNNTEYKTILRQMNNIQNYNQ
jgi:hypothetical protein